MSEAPLRVAVVVGRDGAAAEEIVRTLPAQPGIALVFALTDARQLAKRLRGAAQIPVVDVHRSMALEREHIYVLPKDREIAIHKSWLAIDQPDGHGSRDRLLRSLADSLGPDCAAVILAGRGTDGVLGAKRVKESGGITICQLAGEDETSELPRMASATGIIDLVLPTIEIGPRLISLTRESDIEPDQLGEQVPAGDLAAFADILTMMYARTGHDFNAYKPHTLYRRLIRRMHISGVASIVEYKRHLHDRPAELNRLFRDFLISVTDFFRDPPTFEVLAREVVPRLFKGKSSSDQVRVWVPGCATGEEAYSLAMLLSEHASQIRNAPQLQIFASDIDEDALREARAGIYPEAIATDVNEERLQRFFTHEHDHYRVSHELRSITVFSTHNLLRDPPFSRLDLVSCRGVLLDLRDDWQERALDTFHFALRPNGLLLLGAAEQAREPHFAPLDAERHLYVRKTAPLGRVSPQPTVIAHPMAAVYDNRDELHERALAQSGLATALIDKELDVLHISPAANVFFKFAAGELTRHVLRLVLPALSPALGRAIAAARQPSRGSATRTVRFEDAGRQRCIEVRVRSVSVGDHDALLVMFDEIDSDDAFGADVPVHLARMIGELEEDLRVTREQLRTTVEQYEVALHELRASNDELHAMNEELRSASEELEAGREELQAVNTELLELNRELKARVLEVTRANTDLQNLMTSTDVGAVFLDRDLKIVRFTPHSKKLFNLIDSDIGRSFGDITHRWEATDLVERATEVLTSGITVEHELRTADHRIYQARLTPYRSAEQRIDGVVLSFVDRTNMRKAEALLHATGAILLAHDANLALLWSSIAGTPATSITDVFAHAEHYLELVRQVRDTGHAAHCELDVSIAGARHTFAFRIEPTRENEAVAGVTAMGLEVTK